MKEYFLNCPALLGLIQVEKKIWLTASSLVSKYSNNPNFMILIFCCNYSVCLYKIIVEIYIYILYIQDFCFMTKTMWHISINEIKNRCERLVVFFFEILNCKQGDRWNKLFRELGENKKRRMNERRCLSENSTGFPHRTIIIRTTLSSFAFACSPRCARMKRFLC